MLPTPRKHKRGAQRITPSSDGSSSQHRPGKRRQINSPYVSQGLASCCICLDTAVQLVQLGACSHAVCRGCMGSHLLHAFKLAQLPLRCPLPQCRARLALQPALQLMEQQVPGSKAIAAQALLAGADPLSVIPDDLCFACPYVDCQVPMELDAQQLPDMPSDCPSCNRPICPTCRSTWHSGLLCAQYQALAGRKQPGSNNSSFSYQPLQQQQQQQEVPLISAASDFSSKWQQQKDAGSLEQHQQWHKVNVALSTTVGSSWPGSGGNTVRMQDVGSCEQDGMAWSPSKAA